VAINAAGSAQAENIGFAIAIDVAKPLIARPPERSAEHATWVRADNRPPGTVVG
jgi:S1-C subfamily serine protease